MLPDDFLYLAYFKLSHILADIISLSTYECLGYGLSFLNLKLVTIHRVVVEDRTVFYP
jgi:hypothetical protein